jgi:hypothetical protein
MPSSRAGQPGFGRPNNPVKPTGPAWKVRPDGTRVFRMVTPLVLWWIWVAFAAANLIDLAVQGRVWFDVQAAVSLIAVTGVMYACTFRPLVLTDAEGITVYNPLRIHRIAFSRVKGVYLGDSVEIVCGRAPGKKDKTIYTWALYSSRRSRLRAANTRRSSRFTSRHMPEEAQALARQHTGHIMAEELARLVNEAHTKAAEAAGVTSGSESAGATDAIEGADVLPGADKPSANGKARKAGASSGPASASTASAVASGDAASVGPVGDGLIGTLQGGWDWPSVAAVLVPIAALIVVILIK